MKAGDLLGPYQVLEKLGEGGMGEVYKARDTRLDRTVAIKILPTDVSADTARRARFEREAKTIAALDHPHICVLHDVGDHDGTMYLVMEYLLGETLATRLEKGPLALDQAVKVATEIAEALAAAHRQGIVHRDLKPGNVMLTKSGAKLLDFGLAKLNASAGEMMGATAVATHAPTTEAGTLLGTVPYMAPELLEGQEADARTDLFAFGCVLYEMITGRRAFRAESRASLIASILKDTPPPIQDVQPVAPPALDRIVSRCLEKDPEERWQSAQDLLHELQWVARPTPQGTQIVTRARRREVVAWVLALLALVAAGYAVSFSLRSRSLDAPQVLQFDLPGPSGSVAALDSSAGVISPDGRTLVLTASDRDGVARLWTRRLDTGTEQALPGTEDAQLPFWSPDSRFVAFFAEGQLRKAPVGGGAATAICDAPQGRGGAWGRDDTIVFAPMLLGGLSRVPAAGGKPTEILRPDAALGQKGLRFPSFLPDGKHFVYIAVPRRQDSFDVYLAALDGGQPTRLMSADTVPVYAEPGYLLFTRDNVLVAQRFDASALRPTGPVIRLGAAPSLSTFDGAPAATASATGVLAHLSTVFPETELVWLDREGREVGQVPLPRGMNYLSPYLSADGRWAAVTRPTSPRAGDLWVVDLQRAVARRLTSDGQVVASANAGVEAIWSPDGTRIAYMRYRAGVYDVYQVAIDGTSPPEPLVQSDRVFKAPACWSPDGKYLVFSQDDEDDPSGSDLWVLPFEGDRKPFRYLHTPFQETGAAISPDGRWLAYVSNETGKGEVYVDSFPRPSHKQRVSTSGGMAAQWSKDGSELLIATGDMFLAVMGPLYVVPVQFAPTFKPGLPRLLFTPRQDIAGEVSATPDLQRFLVAVPAPRSAPPAFRIVVNWQGLLRQ